MTTTTSTLRLENRALQALLVVTTGTLAWLLVAMFDRFEQDHIELAEQVEAIESANKERDSKLAELVLQIESRLATLEARN
jgi:hypothetical protein